MLSGSRGGSMTGYFNKSYLRKGRQTEAEASVVRTQQALTVAGRWGHWSSVGWCRVSPCEGCHSLQSLTLFLKAHRLLAESIALQLENSGLHFPSSCWWGWLPGPEAPCSSCHVQFSQAVPKVDVCFLPGQCVPDFLFYSQPEKTLCF